MQKKNEKINIVGAGLVGSLLSLYLGRRGYQVEVFERRPDMRTNQISAGRSINLALSTRGIHALHEMGLEKEILDLAIPMLGRMVHSVTGDTQLQRYGRSDAEYINSISRGDLNKVLMTAAEKTGNVKIHFDKNLSAVDLQKKTLTLKNEQSGESKEVGYDTVIGTDGSASVLRAEIAKKTSTRPSEEVLDYGYKELILPAGPQGKFLLEKNALHIWPRGTYMLIALANLDGSFTCTLFLKHQGRQSFEDLKTPKDVMGFFKVNFPDVIPLFPNLTEEFFRNPTGKMVTVKSQAWCYKNALLLGDAAHAIVPFFGQGMNCGFEDCSVFNSVLESGEDWPRIFERVFTQRKENTDAIADMAVENFVEMRDKVAQPQFQLEKGIEKILNSHFPEYRSRYQLVTFTRVPYSVALKAGAIQNEILSELREGITKPEELNVAKAEKLLNEKLFPYLKEFKKETYGFQN